jgi:hypothetical protein
MASIIAEKLMLDDALWRLLKQMSARHLRGNRDHRKRRIIADQLSTVAALNNPGKVTANALLVALLMP